MKQIVCFLPIILLFFNSSQAQKVKFKNGVVIGDRSKLIAQCVQKAENKMIQLKGLKIESKRYCECMVDKVYPAITSTELMRTVDEGNFIDLLLRDDIFVLFQSCVVGNTKLQDDYAYGNNLEDFEAQVKTGIKVCIDDMMASPEIKGVFTRRFAKDLCACAIPKLLRSGLQYGDLQDLGIEGTDAFDAIIEPCFDELMGN